MLEIHIWLICTCVSRILKWPLVTTLLGLQTLLLSMDRTYEYGQIVTPSIRLHYIQLHPSWLKGQILLLTLKNCHIMETAKRQGMVESHQKLRTHPSWQPAKKQRTWSCNGEKMSSANSSELGRGLQSFRCDQSSSCPCDFSLVRAWVEDAVNSYLDSWPMETMTSQSVPFLSCKICDNSLCNNRKHGTYNFIIIHLLLYLAY